MRKEIIVINNVTSHLVFKVNNDCFNAYCVPTDKGAIYKVLFCLFHSCKERGDEFQYVVLLLKYRKNKIRCIRNGQKAHGYLTHVGNQREISLANVSCNKNNKANYSTIDNRTGQPAAFKIGR